ncbi:hypothetical protein DB32_002219 [Sandaracinus amylolyticus]|uniref:Thiol:disulfide interchange protein DsbD N-terminal domain-containing protein n=1 Tax=Sandaracinus amylolyticus TaxID=927083 RepID=A0A0F6YGT6_9BACT|nr:hypothetical protein DB32_002219 [Sandaracinus amylolyticus]
MLAISIATFVARAQSAPAIEVALDPPARIAVGARAEVIVRVRAGERAGRPMLITPSSEGSAIEVVRGRLTRGDAEDASGELRFRVPIVARTAGTAVMRVRIDGFECEAGHCRALVVEASAPIEVLPAS